MLKANIPIYCIGGLKKIFTIFFQKDSFLRDLSIVMTGTTIAQLISFAMMPIVSRFFNPEDFGIFGSYNAVLSVISAAITLQYAQAIALPKHKETGINLLFVSGLSVILVTALVAFCIILFPKTVQNLFNLPNRWFLLLILIAIIVSGLNQTFQSWCIRVKAFKATSTSQVIRSTFSICIWVSAGIGHLGAIGLVLGSILADILACLNLTKIVKSDLRSSNFSIVWEKMKKVAHEFRDFPLFAAPQNVMNAFSNGLPVLFLGYFYGTGVAGAYSFSIKVLQTPMGFLLTPLRQVLLQKASEVNNQSGNLYALFLKTTCGLMFIALIPCIIFFIWAPQIFSLIFGNEWFEAGKYARWLILWVFVLFCNVPAVLFSRILRQQRNLFIYDCLLLLSRTAVLIFGGMYCHPLTTVISISIVGLIFNILLIGWIGTLSYLKSQNMCA